MKTILTTIFAIAVMVFAFNTNPVMAGDASKPWSSNEQQVNDVDETETARYEPDCRWKWKLDTNTGNWGWVCIYYNEGEVPGDNVAWDTEPGEDAYCWETVGRNGPVMICAPDDFWNSEGGEREFAGYMEYCQRSGNCMMFEDSDGDDTFEVAGRYHDSRSLNLDRDRKDYNDSQKNRVAHGCRIQSDGSMHCPGDAWNSENDDRQIAIDTYSDDSSFDDWLPYLNPNWFLNEESREEAVAGWLDHCRKHGNCMMQHEDGQDNKERVIASFLDYCEQHGNCMMLEDAETNDGFGGRDVADSGNEGPTSAAQESDQ